DNGRLDVNLAIGAAWVDDFDLYPNSLRYFAGGDGSVRGYTYKELGPKDDKGVVIGGRQMFVTSLEYDHRIAKNWALAVFVDAGNAYNDTLDKLFVGAGFGARWLAPFGALKLDFGWPVSEDAGLGDFQFYIGFGATL
ncbi:MAG TPA: outer membrane protein assembly factor, partial [Chromatiaceae bacterium]|nr:outer membrane protein assembly factor [Chromatiaceae bacterium]